MKFGIVLLGIFLLPGCDSEPEFKCFEQIGLNCRPTPSLCVSEDESWYEWNGRRINCNGFNCDAAASSVLRQCGLLINPIPEQTLRPVNITVLCPDGDIRQLTVQLPSNYSDQQLADANREALQTACS